VYAVFASLDGTMSGVYEIDPGATTPKAPATPIWGTGDDPDDGGSLPPVTDVIRVFAVNDGTDEWLAISVRRDDSANPYSLHVTNDGSTFTELANSVAATAYLDATDDPANTSVAFMTGTRVLVDEDGISNGTDETFKSAPSVGTAQLTGMLYDPVGTLLWLADSQGHLYTAADLTAAGSWSKSSERTITVGNTTVVLHFQDFAAVPDGTGTTTLLVGSQSHGYFVLGDATLASHTTEPQSPAVADSNYRSTDLGSTTVQTFFVDPAFQTDYPVPVPPDNAYQLFDGYLLFAGTPNQGLWRALSHDGPIQWVRE
jgi:hypothetical protein